MSISLLTNVTSLQAQQNLNKTQNSLSASIERLSSGMRINSASDDAAGLGISESLQSQISSLGQASQNANDAVSLSQVAEGGMSQMQGIVSRMRDLAVESANSTLGATQRGYIQTEFTQLASEINRISATSNFNGQQLLDGSASAGLTFQVGINNTSNDRLSLSITRLVTSTLGSTSLHLASVSLSTATNAQAALGAFDAAITQLSTARANLGAVQNRMQDAISNLSTTTSNLTAANSAITDVDIASETAKMTQDNILEQAGVSVLSQANQLPSIALKLLGQ
ncbi:MAG TPA: flagellin [Kofleriaceae bacterium]|nr:flagellin [Kofleriaceae bacterium]